MIKEIRKRPFLRLLFFWITGILLQNHLPCRFYSWGLLVLGLAIIVCTQHPRIRCRYEYNWLWGSGFSCLVLFLSIQTMAFSSDKLKWSLPVSEKITVVAELTDSPSEKTRSYLCDMKVIAQLPDGNPLSGQRVQVYFPKDSMLFSLLPGNLLLLNMSFMPPGHRNEPLGYMNYLHSNQIVASGYCPSGSWTQLPRSDTSLPIRYYALHIRHKLVKQIEKLSLTDTEKATLSALTFGYKSAVDKETMSDFSTTGVMHIISVSGFHVAIVCAFISFLMSFFPNTIGFHLLRYGVTVAVVWGFVYVSGLSSPAVRAGLMLTFFLTGRILSRRADSYNILAASAFLMLVYNPYYLFDTGFQLSYIAVFFILYLQPRLNRLIEIRNPILSTPWSWTTVTVAAQAGTTPLSLYAFGRFSLVFLLTNIPVAAIATLLIPLTLGWTIFSQLVPSLTWLQMIVEKLTRSLLWIVTSFGRIPGASFTFTIGFIEMLFAYGIVGFLLFYIRRRTPISLLAGLSCLLIILLIMLKERFVY